MSITGLGSRARHTTGAGEATVWCVFHVLTCISYGRRGTSSNKVDLPPLAILKNMHSFVSQITWWVPHVFVWRSPKRSKMSSHRIYVPHTKYMWTSTWPGLAGFGVLSADSVHARPPYSTCRPGHLPRGSVPPGVPDEAVLLSKAPGGSPYILYGR